MATLLADRPACGPAGRITRSLLGYGVIAGPLYLTVSLAQALTRPGFDLSRHAWSLLENGSLGWIQIANFIVTGLMTVTAAVGIRRALPGSGWVPALVAGYGLGLVAAGFFRADPAGGFPAGTPATTTISWHGMLHLMSGALGFGCLIAACLMLGRRFARDRQRGLAWFSVIAGVALFAGFAGVASGSPNHALRLAGESLPTTLAFAAAIVLVSAWLSAISVHFYRRVV
jgi:hypothetical membrane protein